MFQSISLEENILNSNRGVGDCLISSAPDFKGARWLKFSGMPASQGQWFIARGKLDYQDSATGCRALVAADSKYWLYLNGKIVVAEGGLKRGPSPGNGYFDIVDLSDHILVGNNFIAVLVWHFGRSGFSHSDSGTGGLLLEIQNQKGQWVGGTGNGWMCMEHPAYFNAGHLRDGYRLSESGIGYDARRDPGPWMSVDYSHPDLIEATVAEAAHSGPWGKLSPRPIPMFYWGDRIPLKKISETEICGGMKLIKVKLPANIQFVPYFQLRAPAGIKVMAWSSLDTSAMLIDYTTSEGDQYFESPAWMNGEEICVLTDDPRQILEIGYRETGYASQPKGHFESSDSMLNSLWKKSLRTLHVTMRDTFMDCPCRERAQWPGDFIIQLGQVPYCLDSAAQDLVGKAFAEFANWQKPDGVLFGPLPGNWDKELPAQMLSLVSRFGSWTYFLHTARWDEMDHFYSAAKRYMAVWKIGGNGLIIYRQGGWDWLDWGDLQDQEPMLNAWFALALQGCSLMADALGRTEDKQTWDRMHKDFTEAFRQFYWRPGIGFASPGYAAPADERVQALAVLAGIATQEHREDVLKILCEGRACSPYMEKYVLEAILELGQTKLALERMRNRYSGMVRGSSSTLSELWTELDSPGSSLNHSWSGGPLTILSSCIAGLKPAAPGWSKVLLKPNIGDLTFFQAVVETPHGAVEAKYSSSPEHCLELHTPVSASLNLSGLAPIHFGRAVSDNGQNLAISSGIFDLPAGKWKLVPEVSGQISCINEQVC